MLHNRIQIGPLRLSPSRGLGPINFGHLATNAVSKGRRYVTDHTARCSEETKELKPQSHGLCELGPDEPIRDIRDMVAVVVVEGIGLARLISKSVIGFGSLRKAHQWPVLIGLLLKASAQLLEGVTGRKLLLHQALAFKVWAPPHRAAREPISTETGSPSNADL